MLRYILGGSIADITAALKQYQIEKINTSGFPQLNILDSEKNMDGFSKIVEAENQRLDYEKKMTEKNCSGLIHVIEISRIDMAEKNLKRRQRIYGLNYHVHIEGEKVHAPFAWLR